MGGTNNRVELPRRTKEGESFLDGRTSYFNSVRNQGYTPNARNVGIAEADIADTLAFQDELGYGGIAPGDLPDTAWNDMNQARIADLNWFGIDDLTTDNIMGGIEGLSTLGGLVDNTLGAIQGYQLNEKALEAADLKIADYKYDTARKTGSDAAFAQSSADVFGRRPKQDEPEVVGLG